MSSTRTSREGAGRRSASDAWAAVTGERRSQAILAAQDAIVEHLTRGAGAEEVLPAVVGLVHDVTAVAECRVEVAREGRVPDAEADPGTVRIPLVAPDGEALGRLVLRVPGPALGEEDAAVVERAARLATMVLARAAERRRLGESVALLGSVLESTEDGILSVDSEGRTAGFNRTFTDMWRIGADLAESRDDARMIEYVLAQLTDPDGFVAGVTALYGSAATSFDELHFHDGRVFERYSQPQVLDGEAVGRVWSFRDVTATRRLQRGLELFSDVATAANSASTVEQALAETLAAVCRYAGWQLGHALLVDERDGVLARSAWHEAVPGEYAAVREAVQPTFPDTHSLPGRVLASGRPEVVVLPAETAGPAGACASAHGLGWMCAFPVLARNEVVGVLEFWAARPPAYDDPLRQALRQVGAQVGRVIERDRAERRLARHTRQLERLTRELDSVLNSAGEGIYGLDAAGAVTFANEAAARLLGVARDSLVGRRIDDVVRTERAETSRGGATPALGLGVGVVTGRHVRHDGTAFDSELSSAPVVQDGVVVGSVSVLRDITERRAVDRLKDEFIAMVSHELRTPLTSIRGALGLLGAGSAGELAPRAARMVEVATASSDRLIRLINDILAVERMAAGRLVVEPRPTAAGSLMRTAAEEMSGLADSSGVLVRVSGPALDARVLADPDRIVQTIANLLGNAVKYSAPGDVVALTATAAGAEVRFDVADTGPGIPTEQLESVFEAFRQVDGSDTRRNGGTGLGLAICRGLVEHHGGRIWAGSELGVGTTLSFTLPAAPPEAAGVSGDVEESATAQVSAVAR